MLNSRQKATYIIDTHMWEIYYLTKDLNFCPPSLETYISLPERRASLMNIFFLLQLSYMVRSPLFPRYIIRQ